MEGEKESLNPIEMIIKVIEAKAKPEFEKMEKIKETVMKHVGLDVLRHSIEAGEALDIPVSKCMTAIMSSICFLYEHGKITFKEKK
jgi:hypothetical protein